MIPTVIELRQYTLHPGRREALIALFEREFVESQEAVGIHLIGLFRDLDDDDRFVWLRGFADMQARQRALEDFYFGPIWSAQRDAANATMVDSDDVLLLRPAHAGSGVSGVTEPSDVDKRSTGIVMIGVHALDEIESVAVEGLLAALDLTPLAFLVTEPAENSFPRLPVRTDGPFLVWVAKADDDAIAARTADAVAAGRLGAVSQLLRLAPTARSRLRG